MLNSVSIVGSVGAWVSEWRESNFGRGYVDRVGPQSFDKVGGSVVGGFHKTQKNQVS